MNWVDIPACRILEVTCMEVREQFESLSEDGEPLKEYESIYRVIRKSDSKIFKMASIVPMRSFGNDCLYLDEL